MSDDAPRGAQDDEEPREGGEDAPGGGAAAGGEDAPGGGAAVGGEGAPGGGAASGGEGAPGGGAASGGPAAPDAPHGLSAAEQRAALGPAGFGGAVGRLSAGKPTPSEAQPDPDAPPPPSRTQRAIAWFRRLPLYIKAGLGIVTLLAVVLVAALVSGGAGPLPAVTGPATTLADPVPYDGRSPVQVAETEQRVLVELLRPALGELDDARAMGAEAQRVYIAGLKREQITLRSGLEARGVVFRDVVSYYRVWNGFAATVRTRDIPRLSYTGSQVRTVRRAYPASSEPVPVPGKAPIEKPGLNGQPPVAVLDTGIDAGALNGFADPGYDAVDRDRDPKPGTAQGRTETSGTALAGVIAAAGERVLPIRIASLRGSEGAIEAVSTTDQLIAGLEHAVDPNGDSDTSDHVPVALVGVNAPYAGFSNSPEADAVVGAAGLGTLVIAPAGNEGAAAPGSGTVGSPASAPDAIAVGALTGTEPAARTSLELAGSKLAEAAVLAGDPPDGGPTAGPVTDTDPAVLGRATTRIRGRIVVVKAGANPAAQASAAAAVGAKAVLLADPADDRPLPTISAGRAAVPVIGITGDAAKKVLEAKPGTEVRFGPTQRAERPDALTKLRPSPNSAQGPSAGGLPKPDLASPGSELTARPGGGAAVAGGTAIAAASTAAVAVELARTRPDLSPAQLRAAMINAAVPAGLPPDRTGAGLLKAPEARPGVVSDPPTAVSGALDPIQIELSAAASTNVELIPSDGATVAPQRGTLLPGQPTPITVRLTKPGTMFGRLEAVAPGAGESLASIPFLVRPDTVEPIPLGELEVSGGGRRVRFTLGSFKRGTQTQIQVAERLILDLIDSRGNPIRQLTVRNGARELMPAEYSFTVTRGSLPSGRYAFRARAWAPRQAQGEPTERRSAYFNP